MLRTTFFLLLGLLGATAAGSNLERLNARYFSLEKSLIDLRQKVFALNRRLEEMDGRVIDIANVAEGRLTTETGVALSTSDRTNQTTIYYTPYMGSNIALYSGTVWNIYAFTESSLALSGLTANRNYDVFLYNNSGTITMELSAAWNSDNITRTDALALQNGVYVKSSAPTRRYVGTIRVTSATQTQDSSSQRFVWNYQNRLPRRLQINDSTNSWTYGTNSWRAANGSATNRVEFVIGTADVLVEATVFSLQLGSAAAINYYSNGVGVDTTTNITSQVRGGGADNVNTTQTWGEYKGYPPLGYHYLSWNERSTGTNVTVYGDNGDATSYSAGILGELGG